MKFKTNIILASLLFSPYLQAQETESLNLTVNTSVSTDGNKMICQAALNGDDINNYDVSYLWETSLIKQKFGPYSPIRSEWSQENSNTLSEITPVFFTQPNNYSWDKCAVTVTNKVTQQTQAAISEPVKYTNKGNEIVSFIHDNSNQVRPNFATLVSNGDDNNLFLNIYYSFDMYNNDGSDVPQFNLNVFQNRGNIKKIAVQNSFLYLLDDKGQLFGGEFECAEKNDSEKCLTYSNTIINTPLTSKISQFYLNTKSIFATTEDNHLYTWKIGTSPNNPIEILLPDYNDPIEKMLLGDDTENTETQQAPNFILTKSGKLYAWGENTLGELGLGSSTSPVLNPTLVQPAGLLPFPVKDISYSKSLGGITSVILTNGDVYYWGQGIMTPSKVKLPHPAGSFNELNSEVSDISHFHHYVILDNGDLYKINFDTNKKEISPVKMNLPNKVKNISCSYSAVKAENPKEYCIASLEDSSIYSWGDDNSNGQLGNETKLSSPIPSKVETNASGKIIKILAKDNSSFALYDDGSLYGWGNNYWSYMNSTQSIILSPVKIQEGIDKVIDINYESGYFNTIFSNSKTTLSGPYNFKQTIKPKLEMSFN